eukprot:7609183-Pyramimonas_sp.AAC.1
MPQGPEQTAARARSIMQGSGQDLAPSQHPGTAAGPSRTWVHPEGSAPAVGRRPRGPRPARTGRLRRLFSSSRLLASPSFGEPPAGSASVSGAVRLPECGGYSGEREHLCGHFTNARESQRHAGIAACRPDQLPSPSRRRPDSPEPFMRWLSGASCSTRRS